MDDHTELALELVTLDIRAQQAHRELQSYNDTGKFQYVHRLTIHTKYKKDQLAELRKLKSEDPSAFMKEITNTTQNIRRIESQLHNKKYKDEEERQSWQNNLEKARIKQKAIQDILS
ncbi:MAG: hypothetical protein LBR26_13380 [Prevotella sp.]|nr:hypothetical protein [Prevotella sp.]